LPRRRGSSCRAALSPRAAPDLKKKHHNANFFPKPQPPTTKQKTTVGNLSWGCDATKLAELFSRFGNVSDAFIPSDRQTGRSRGFGFVTLDAAAAENAVKELDGTEFMERTIRVNPAQPLGDRGGGGGGRGGYGGGGGGRGYGGGGYGGGGGGYGGGGGGYGGPPGGGGGYGGPPGGGYGGPPQGGGYGGAPGGYGGPGGY
jgi:hypothetical protein